MFPLWHFCVTRIPAFQDANLGCHQHDLYLWLFAGDCTLGIFVKIYTAADTILWTTLLDFWSCKILFWELNILWLLGISVGVLRCYWRRHDHAQINWEAPLLLTGLRMAVYTDGWRVLACLSDWQEGGKGGWVGMFSGVSWEWATGGEHLVALSRGDWPCKIGGAPGSSIGFALIFGKFMTQCKNWEGHVF